MRQYPILFLIISSCLLFCSCAVKTVDGLVKTEKAPEHFHAPYFSDSNKDYIYKASIAVYGRDFGGIFIAKKVNDTLYRAAFTTEFGNKLFDFEITDDSFRVKYILDELNKKIVVNTLKRDFMLLLKQQHEVVAGYEDDKNSVLKCKDGKRYNYLFTDKATGQLQKLVNATKSKEKTIITYTAKNDILAQNIVIDHKNLQLRIELNYIE